MDLQSSNIINTASDTTWPQYPLKLNLQQVGLLVRAMDHYRIKHSS